MDMYDLSVEFGRACRVDIEEIMAALDKDVDLILQCYYDSVESGELVLIPFYRCVLPRNHKRQPNQLYADIISTLQRKGKSSLLLDIMPLVDSYLEHVTMAHHE